MDRLLRIAAEQHSVFTRRQACAVGISDKSLAALVRRGFALKIHRGVYLLAGIRIGPEQRVMAACLACEPDGVASHVSAAFVWGFVDEVGSPHVTVSTGTSRSHRGIVVHRTERLESVRRRGFPVTPPMRTLLDLSGCVSDERLERMLDDAHRRRLLEISAFATYLDATGNRNTPGSGRLRRLVSLRDPERPIGSDAETVFFRILRSAGLPLPIPQYEVTAGARIRRIDFAYPDLKLGIEIDGFETHGTREAFEADRVRQNELELLGWHVIRFTWTQLRKDPRGVAAVVRDARCGLAVRSGV